MASSELKKSNSAFTFVRQQQHVVTGKTHEQVEKLFKSWAAGIEADLDNKVRLWNAKQHCVCNIAYGEEDEEKEKEFLMKLHTMQSIFENFDVEE